MKTTFVGFLWVMLMISSVVANDCPPFDKEPYSYGYYFTALLISDGVLRPFYILVKEDCLHSGPLGMR